MNPYQRERAKHHVQSCSLSLHRMNKLWYAGDEHILSELRNAEQYLKAAIFAVEYEQLTVMEILDETP